MNRKQKKQLIVDNLFNKYVRDYKQSQEYLKDYRRTGNERYFTAYAGKSYGLLPTKWELNRNGYSDSEIELIVENMINGMEE